MSPRVQSVPVDIARKQSLEAVILRACSDCGAPAVYKSASAIRDGWPGCYVEPGEPLEDKPVGELCPNCGIARHGHTEELGEVWHRVWRIKPVGLLDRLRNILRK
jgi:rubredoxin